MRVLDNLVVLFACFFYLTFANDPLSCPINHQSRVPDNEITDPLRYRFLESSFTIFGDMKVPCSGLLREWRYFAQNTLVYGVYLAVFRKRLNESTIFELVGSTHIYENLAHDGPNENGRWHTVFADPPIPVRQGDYIGVYYEKFKVKSDFVTISSLGPLDLKRNGKDELSYIMLFDSYDMERSNGIVDTKLAVRALRKPALYAYFSHPEWLGPTTETVHHLLQQLQKSNENEEDYDYTDRPEFCYGTPEIVHDCLYQSERAYFDIYQSSCHVFHGCSSSLIQSDDGLDYDDDGEHNYEDGNGYGSYDVDDGQEIPNNFASLNECINVCKPENQPSEVNGEPVPRKLSILNGKRPLSQGHFSSTRS